ncbi:MAG: CinA family protein [Novosphingobium sp.]|nr:CinA family protein [Novosphingobium sp.]
MAGKDGAIHQDAASAPAPDDLPDGADELAAHAEVLLRRAQKNGHSLATAESCTGGLLAALFTDIEGLSSTFERGFVTYSERSKCELLGLEPSLIARHGIVSREVAQAMASGALEHSAATIAIGITGFAGHAGPHDEPGLVHLAVSGRGLTPVHRECHFGAAPRDRVRHCAIRAALEMLETALATQHR